MKKLILLFVLLTLAACSGDDGEDTADNTSGTTEVIIVGPTVDPSTNTPPPTVGRSTLPPVQDLDSASATPRATRTAAATLTLGPSATSNVNPDVTPFDMLGPSPTPIRIQPDPDSGQMAFTMTFGELLEVYRFGGVPLDSDDQVVSGSQDVFVETGQPTLRFRVLTPDDETITVKVEIELVIDEGGIVVTTGDTSLEENPEEIYGDAALVASMVTLLQESLNNVVDAVVFASGYEGAYGVANIEITPDGIVIFLDMEVDE
jgi:hypothetical protein